jgi:phage terminase large subunit
MFQVTTGIKRLLEVQSSPSRIKEVRGGTWAGKTYDIVAIAIDKAIKSEGLDMTIIAETIPAVKAGALKDFMNIMRLTNRWDTKRYNRTDRIYTFTGGSKIQFTSFADEDAARQAGKRDWLFMNEMNTIPQPICDALMIRTEGDIWGDYNPVAHFWFNNEHTGSEGVITCSLTYRDNEALPQTILDELMKRRKKAKTSTYWKNWCDVYLDGQTGNLEGVCIPQWKQIDLPEEARLLCYGMDFGYSNDPTTLIALYKYNEAYIFDEIIYKKGLHNSDISNLLKTYEVAEIVYADSAEPKSINEIKRYGHKILPVTKGKDSIVYGIELINQNEVYITSRSLNLINELRNYAWIVDKDGNKVNKPIDAFNHCIDAARYAIMSQLENPNKGKYFIN